MTELLGRDDDPPETMPRQLRTDIPGDVASRLPRSDAWQEDLEILVAPGGR